MTRDDRLCSFGVEMSSISWWTYLMASNTDGNSGGEVSWFFSGPFPLLPPPHILIGTLNTCSMWKSQHITALNDLTDNYNRDIPAVTETWIRSTSLPAELMDATQHHTATPLLRSPSSSHPFKSISAVGTAFLLIEPIHNFSLHSYSSFEYSSVTFN